MSNKFEIINGKWIKNLQEHEPHVAKKIPERSESKKRIFDAEKLSSINNVSSHRVLEKYRKEMGYEWSIYLHGQGSSMSFYYQLNEQEQYELDLKQITDLLFNG